MPRPLRLTRAMLIALTLLVIAAPFARATDDPQLITSSNSVDYGDQYVGTQPTHQIIATNSGSAPLHISHVVAATTSGPSGSFALPFDECTAFTLDPGEHCEVDIGFSVQAIGGATGTVTFSSDDPDGPTVVSTTGNGVAPPKLKPSPAARDFGTQWIGSETFDFITISDDSATALKITSTGIGADASSSFSLWFDDCSGATLSGNRQCDVGIRFRPTTIGHLTANLTFNSNDPFAPVVPLSGTGVAAGEIVVAPNSFGFGTVAVGATSDPQTVTVTNTGPQTLFIYPWFEQNIFETDGGTCDRDIAPQMSCSFDVRVTPKKKGTISGTMNVGYVDNYGFGIEEIPISLVAVLDTTPPISTFDSSVAEPVLAGQGTVTGTAHDDLSGVRSETINLVPVAAGAPATVAAALACTGLSCTWSWSVPADLAPGVYTATAHATDKAGNVESNGPSLTVIVV